MSPLQFAAAFLAGWFGACLTAVTIMNLARQYERIQDEKSSKFAAPLRGTYAVVRLHSLAADRRN